MKPTSKKQNETRALKEQIKSLQVKKKGARLKRAKARISYKRWRETEWMLQMDAKWMIHVSFRYSFKKKAWEISFTITYFADKIAQSELMHSSTLNMFGKGN